MSCPTVSDCFAVGEHEPSQQTGRTLVERWNGKSWTVVSSPSVASSLSKLYAITCAAHNACAAVGSYLGTQGSATLAEMWSGTSWHVVPSANSAFGSGSLSGVSCSVANDCLAVGTYPRSTGVNATLIEEWQGRAWLLISHPDPTPSKGSGLFGVACPLPTACEAVGDNSPTASTQATLVEQRR